MNELFRFLLSRPANLPAKDEIHFLTPTFFQPGIAVANLLQDSQHLLSSERALTRVEELKHFDLVQQVLESMPTGVVPKSDVIAVVQSDGSTISSLVGSASFQEDERRLADTLVAAKLVSGSPAIDARGLARMAQGYDAIRRASEGVDPIRLRPHVMPEFRKGDRPIEPDRPQRPATPAHPPTDGSEAALHRLDKAIFALKNISASHFEPAKPLKAEDSKRPEPERKLHEGDVREPLTEQVSSQLDRPWHLAKEAIASLPDDVRNTLVGIGADPKAVGLPVMLQKLDDERVKLLTDIAMLKTARPADIVKIGAGYYAVEADEWVGWPSGQMPSGHGSLKPVGIGDLLLVKQHVLRYEGGELAHVENVLKSEHLSRETRRLERTETTIVEETESAKEDEHDTQSTDRFSLKRETSQTIKEDSEFKAGVSVDAKYGPFVEVKANADFGTHSSSEESTKQATEFSKDVVSRSASKVAERVLHRRSTTTISEFEEKYSHGFDNTLGTGNISGVYQWVDKVLQAQVYNYGKRMLFDVTLPEPGTAFIAAQTKSKNQGQSLVKPPPFTLSAAQINEGNYRQQAQLYNVTGLEAPPPPFKTISKALDAVVSQDPNESSKSQELSIDDGFSAKYALFQRSYRNYSDSSWKVLIGNQYVNAMGTNGYFDLSNETGSIAVAYVAYKVRDLAATIEIFCERTVRAMTAWQLKTHAAITQGYLAKVQAYESAVAEAAAAAGVVITGRNPLWNQRLINAELRKQAITFLTAQQFDAFGALETSAEGYPQPSLWRSSQQMPYVRFFEQAFEWEHLSYFCYPYFWGWKPAWGNRMLLDDVDPIFADFLRAGAARTVFPVRPGFEAAVIHYLETGEIWNGGPPPDITSPMYVPIIKEIQEAQGAPGAEVPEGDPWLVRLPTTLVKLRQDDALPAWKKVGEDWQPSN